MIVSIEPVSTWQQLAERATLLIEDRDYFDAMLAKSLPLVDWSNHTDGNPVVDPDLRQYQVSLAYIALCTPTKRKTPHGVYGMKHDAERLARRLHEESNPPEWFIKREHGYCSQYVFAQSCLLAGLKVEFDIVKRPAGQVYITGSPFLRIPARCRSCQGAMERGNRKWRCEDCIEALSLGAEPWSLRKDPTG